MGISTTIVIEGETTWEYERNFDSVMEKHGYSSSVRNSQIINDMYDAVRDAGLDPEEIVEAWHAKKYTPSTLAAGSPLKPGD